ncbi:MAG: aminotransferase class IV [Terriglobia bacterium]
MALHDYILHNGRIVPAAQADLFAGQLGLLAGWGVFSTLRVKDGALFAWDRHWARMSRDAIMLNVAMPPDRGVVESELLRLIEANGHPDCTLRLVVVRNTGGMWEGPTPDSRTSDLLALTADSKGWGESVALTIQPNARFAANEFAGAKVLSWAQNLTWAERATKAGFDEVILLNEHGRVAECTSANIFAVHGNLATTPPLGEGCLGGITREILLEFPGVREGVLNLEDLYSADEVFITSTTRDLLPVARIGDRKPGRDGRLRTQLITAFRNFVATDIARRRGAAVPA